MMCVCVLMYLCRSSKWLVEFAPIVGNIRNNKLRYVECVL